MQYAIRDNLRTYIGGALTIGLLTIICIPEQLAINVGTSKYAEGLGQFEALAQIIRHALASQSFMAVTSIAFVLFALALTGWAQGILPAKMNTEKQTQILYIGTYVSYTGYMTSMLYSSATTGDTWLHIVTCVSLIVVAMYLNWQVVGRLLLSECKIMIAMMIASAAIVSAINLRSFNDSSHLYVLKLMLATGVVGLFIMFAIPEREPEESTIRISKSTRMAQQSALTLSFFVYYVHLYILPSFYYLLVVVKEKAFIQLPVSDALIAFDPKTVNLKLSAIKSGQPYFSSLMTSSIHSLLIDTNNAMPLYAISAVIILVCLVGFFIHISES